MCVSFSLSYHSDRQATTTAHCLLVSVRLRQPLQQLSAPDRKRKKDRVCTEDEIGAVVGCFYYL